MNFVSFDPRGKVAYNTTTQTQQLRSDEIAGKIFSLREKTNFDKTTRWRTPQSNEIAGKTFSHGEM